MSDLPQRAYALISGKYRHLYIIESYQQMDIMGGVVDMVRAKVTKSSSEMIEIEKDKLLSRKPTRSRK